VTRFGTDARVVILSNQSLALWFLGFPEAALATTKRALKDAREIGQAPTLMYALAYAFYAHTLRGDYAAAKARADELVALRGPSLRANDQAALGSHIQEIRSRSPIHNTLGRL
jgi:hypothetical protein